MTCARSGCSNEVTATNTMGPRPRFCNDPECLRIRHLVCLKLYQAREKGDLPPFRRKHPRKVKKEIRERVARVIEGMNTPPPKEPEAPKGNVSGMKNTLVDNGAKLASIDRGTRDGFKRYMTERPFYFQDVFPGKTIKEAWGMVGGR